MLKQFHFISLLFAAIFAISAHAEIYKKVDAEGRVTYSNVKIDGAKKLNLEPANTNFGGTSKASSQSKETAKSPTPSSFPKVDNNTQNQRDAKRREILLQELAQENQSLARAKQAYEDGAANPEVFRTQGGKTFRNVAKYEEKMKNLQADIDTHQRNIDLLKKELNL